MIKVSVFFLTPRGLHIHVAKIVHCLRKRHQPSKYPRLNLSCATPIFIKWITPAIQRVSWSVNYPQPVDCEILYQIDRVALEVLCTQWNPTLEPTHAYCSGGGGGGGAIMVRAVQLIRVWDNLLCLDTEFWITSDICFLNNLIQTGKNV